MRDCYAWESVQNEILQVGSQKRMDVEDERIYVFLPNHFVSVVGDERICSGR